MSTDGSGNNTLNAGVIKSNTGSNTGLSIASDGQITIAQNNPTLTLHATGDSNSTNTTFPKGHVIQTITKEVTGSVSTNHTGDFPNHISDFDITITPKFNNSKIVITFTSSIYPDSNGVHSYFSISRDSVAHFGHASEGLALHQAGSDGMGRWNTFYLRYVDTPGTSGSAITYKLHTRVSSGRTYINYSGDTRANIFLEEVKQ